MKRSSKKDARAGAESPSTAPRRGRENGARRAARRAVPDVWKALILVAALVAAAAAVSLAAVNARLAESRVSLGERRDSADRAGPGTEAEGEPPEAPAPEQIPPPPPPERAVLPPEPPPRANRGTLVFVIDDAGHNLRQLEPFLRFPGPLTIAVLPGLPYSAEAARLVREAGMEVFLHQPMEAVGGQDPGPGAIYSWMGAEETLEVLTRNLAEIAPVAGMNNHQGSRITADERIMETVLAFSRDRGFPFLDSLTTAASVVPELSRRMGIETASRDVFLDNLQDRASIIRAIDEGRAIASRRGSAVMIGHVWSPELAPLLNELYRDLVERGYSFATASQLVSGNF